MRGAYGETDLEKGEIRINKKRHFDKKYKMVNPTGDPHKDLASTVNHELLHVKHPKAYERTIRKMEKKAAHHMSAKRKQTLLDLLK